MHKFPGAMFSLPVLREFIWRKKHLTLAHFGKYCDNYFPTTQIIWDYGFTYIMSEVAILCSPSHSCSEHFRKYRW